MLQSLRERMTGPVAWFVVGLISIPFAFWGLDQFRTGGGDPTLARVGDDKITQSRFRVGYEQRYQRLVQMLGEDFSPDLIDQARFRAAVLDDMVQESMLRQYAESQGYHMTDAALLAFIRDIPAFQEDGRFSPEAYRRMLARQGMSPERFENRLRTELKIEQMRDGVLGSGFVTDADLALAYRLQRQQRFLAIARFDAHAYEQRVEVGDDDVRTRYEARKDQYMAPERVRLAYLDLDLATLEQAEAPGEEVLRVIYEAERQTRFTTPEERRARHILVQFGADRAAAREQIDALATRLQQGEAFTELAREHSDDTASREDGGSLGWIRRGQMVQAFEDALFDAQPGKPVGPVETEFGWHLIEVDEVRPGHTRAFEDEDVQAQLREIYGTREAERRFQELAETLDKLSFENPASLEPAAEATRLTVQTTGWLTRNSDSGLLRFEPVRQAAFSSDVLAGENSRPLQVGPTRLLVIRQSDYEPARQRPLEEVTDRIRDELRREQARAQATADAADALEAVRAGKPMEEAAAAYGVDVQTPGLIRIDTSEVERSLADALFALPRPREGEASFETVTLPNGDVALLALTAVQDADAAAADEPELRRVRERLRDAAAGAEFAAFRGQIEQGIKVRVIRSAEEDAPLQ